MAINMGKKTESKCPVCGLRTISFDNFDCGHILSVFNGGTDSVDNLKPICRPCNQAMGTTNLNDFKKQYYPRRKKS